MVCGLGNTMRELLFLFYVLVSSCVFVFLCFCVFGEKIGGGAAIRKTIFFIERMVVVFVFPPQPLYVRLRTVGLEHCGGSQTRCCAETPRKGCFGGGGEVRPPWLRN
jgi:hypothetical protein